MSTVTISAGASRRGRGVRAAAGAAGRRAARPRRSGAPAGPAHPPRPAGDDARPARRASWPAGSCSPAASRRPAPSPARRPPRQRITVAAGGDAVEHRRAGGARHRPARHRRRDPRAQPPADSARSRPAACCCCPDPPGQPAMSDRAVRPRTARPLPAGPGSPRRRPDRRSTEQHQRRVVAQRPALVLEDRPHQPAQHLLGRALRGRLPLEQVDQPVHAELRARPRRAPRRRRPCRARPCRPAAGRPHQAVSPTLAAHAEGHAGLGGQLPDHPPVPQQQRRGMPRVGQLERAGAVSSRASTPVTNASGPNCRAMRRRWSRAWWRGRAARGAGAGRRRWPGWSAGSTRCRAPCRRRRPTSTRSPLTLWSKPSPATSYAGSSIPATTTCSVRSVSGGSRSHCMLAASDIDRPRLRTWTRSVYLAGRRRRAARRACRGGAVVEHVRRGVVDGDGQHPGPDRVLVHRDPHPHRAVPVGGDRLAGLEGAAGQGGTRPTPRPASSSSEPSTSGWRISCSKSISVQHDVAGQRVRRLADGAHDVLGRGVPQPARAVETSKADTGAAPGRTGGP